MARARPTLPPTTLPPPTNPSSLPVTPYSMDQLLAALPDSMFLEASLPMPTTPINANLPCKKVILGSHQGGILNSATQSLSRPDGEVWLLVDPFHGYDDPSAFSPETEWLGEWPAHSSHNKLAVVLDPHAEETNLSLGLLDSPPRAEELPIDMQ
jgi:hypothetical protein